RRSGGSTPVQTISPSGSPVLDTAPSRATATYDFGSAMRKRCTRVARPTSTSSSPVANGSSVPAWPVRLRPSDRRTRATTSCEVVPGGLSARMRPSTSDGWLRGHRVRWSWRDHLTENGGRQALGGAGRVAEEQRGLGQLDLEHR